jgi:phage-related protein
MVKKLLRKLRNLERDLNNAVNTVSKIPTFLEDAAKDTGKKFVSLIKTPVDEIDKCFGDLDDIIMDTVRELEKWPRTIGDGLRKIFNSINNAFKDLELFI